MKALKVEGKALILFTHGSGFVLAYQATEALHEFILDAGGALDQFDLEGVGADCPQRETANGLYIGELKLADDGPGDWPGSRKACVKVVSLRLATKEEWESHRDGEWPWESIL
jgi:hypothetical protein